MHTILAGQVLLLPAQHTVASAHRLVERPVADMLLLRHTQQQLIHIRHTLVGLHLALLAYQHVARTDKEHRRFGRALLDHLHLLAQLLYVVLDRCLAVLANSVAAELHDDEARTGAGIEVSTLLAVHRGEHKARTTTHRYVIYDDTRRRLQRETIHLPLTREEELSRTGAVFHCCHLSVLDVLTVYAHRDTRVSHQSYAREEAFRSRRVAYGLYTHFQPLAACYLAVVQQCRLTHRAVQPVAAVHVLRTIYQVSLRSLLGVLTPTIDIATLTHRAHRYRLVQR